MSTPAMPQSIQAASEHDRLTLQASAAGDGLDPTSLAGQQAAMSRGDPVQLTGEEGLSGARWGTWPTGNESAMLAAEGSTAMTEPQDREAIAAEVQAQHESDTAAVTDDLEAGQQQPAPPATQPPPAKGGSTSTKK